MTKNNRIQEQAKLSTKTITSRAKYASYEMMTIKEPVRNKALFEMADALEKHMDEILAANRADMDRARERGKNSQFLDRLELTQQRISQMARGVRDLAALPDPIAEMEDVRTLPNGLLIGKQRVPLGCIAIIYEARPNVTADSISLCVKSANAVILRGGSDAIDSNRVIADIMRSAAVQCGIPADAIGFVDDVSRQSATELMHSVGDVDVLIPRGGKELIQAVVREATVPVIQTGAGVCHVYVDDRADTEMACRIIVNAKCSRPSVCNAAETLLVHRDIAERFLPGCAAALRENGVELRGCERTRQIVPDMLPADETDWATEYGRLILSVRIVDSLEDAVSHIRKYGTGHSECIVTQEISHADVFTKTVDAAAVYVNASTRFTDGFEYGLGAEIGISTQKLHARGPMGLRELTSYKYIVIGSGQVR